MKNQKFNAGDKVTVKYPWCSPWNGPGIVERQDSNYVYVRALSGDYKNTIGGHYPDRITLEETMAQKFKVGDKVKLLFKVKSFTSNWANAWVPEMDAAVGTVGTVTRVGHRKNDIDVNFPAVKSRGVFGYPEFALELVKLDPVVGARVKVNYSSGSGWNEEGVIDQVYSSGAYSIKMSAGPYKNRSGSFYRGEFDVLEAPAVTTKQVDQDTTVTVKWTPATNFAKGDRVYVPAVAPASVQQPVVTDVSSLVRKSATPLEIARFTAVSLAKGNSIRRVTADQVRVELDKQGISVKNLAAVFNKDFRNTGVYVSSKQPTRRGGRIAVWEYTGA